MNSTKLPCCQWIPIPEISSVAPEMPVMRDVRFPSYKWMVFVDWATSIHLCIIFSADSWIVVLKMNLHQIFGGENTSKEDLAQIPGPNNLSVPRNCAFGGSHAHLSPWTPLYCHHCLAQGLHRSVKLHAVFQWENAGKIAYIRFSRRNPAPVDNHIIYKVLYIPGGAGFFHQQFDHN